MTNDRVTALQRMLERNPQDARARFGLALEFEKLQQWREAADQLRAYLASTQDQGNAWGRLGNALRRLGDDDGAREAYRTGIEAAYRHGHPSMAREFEELLAEWEE